MWELAETYADIYIQKIEENTEAFSSFFCMYAILLFSIPLRM